MFVWRNSFRPYLVLNQASMSYLSAGIVNVKTPVCIKEMIENFD